MLCYKLRLAGKLSHDVGVHVASRSEELSAVLTNATETRRKNAIMKRGVGFAVGLFHFYASTPACRTFRKSALNPGRVTGNNRTPTDTVLKLCRSRAALKSVISEISADI